MSEKSNDKPKTESSGKAKKDGGATYALPASFQNAWKIFAVVGVLGVGATAAMMFGPDGARAGYSYLFGFYVFLTIALGSLFFVLIQHLTSAGWSVTVRRTAEFFASGLPVFALLFLPIMLKVDVLYPWTETHHAGAEHGAEHGAEPKKEGNLGVPFVREARAQEHEQHAAPPAGAPANERKDPNGEVAPAAHARGPHGAPSGAHEGAAAADHNGDPLELEHEEILEAKQKGWLNKNFWYVRAAGYFAVWTILAWFFFGNSTKQDGSKDPKLTLRSAKWAPLCTFAFGLSLTFAAVDWLMSLDPMWFSTIYGVYIFATSVVSSLAMIIVVTMAFRNGGPLSKVVTVEHYHDLGKLLFGFNVFWAYIGFSQMMLIWYAALPAETPFYHKRWETPSSVLVGNHSGDFWTNVSVAVIAGHFVVAFLFLISRNVKRRLPMLRLGAIWMLAMHVLDMYWFVLPNFEPNTKAAGFSVAFTDVTALLGVGGVYLAFVFFQMTKHALIPTGDPRLARSIAFQNA